jgi:Ni,Fe-hydrogenase I large subunit
MVDLAVSDPATWPSEASGYALGESARGAVGHWVTVRGGRIAEYQVVDGSTWNASPRDADGRRGAMEEALVGTSVADPGRPLELLRVIHSFDPCLSCGVH